MKERSEKKHTLTEKQRKILKFLAENGPQTIYSTNIELFSFSHYHATHTTFKILEKKGYIQKMGEYSNYWWLTSKGIFAVLIDENVKIAPLIRNIEKYRGKDLSAYKPFIEALRKTPILRGMLGAVFTPLLEKYGSELEQKLSKEEMEALYKAFEGSQFKEILEEFLKLHNEIHKSEGLRRE